MSFPGNIQSDSASSTCTTYSAGGNNATKTTSNPMHLLLPDLPYVKAEKRTPEKSYKPVAPQGPGAITTSPYSAFQKAFSKKKKI
jgi:hypothetical protein